MPLFAVRHIATTARCEPQPVIGDARRPLRAPRHLVRRSRTRTTVLRAAAVVVPSLVSCLVPAAALPAQSAADTVRLQPVVVTADRLLRAMSRTTAAVTIIDGAALRAAGITHLAEALRAVPGVTLARSGSAGAQTSMFLRGGESDYVRLLVDGVPMNDPGGAVDLGALTVDQVERIEVVRGPASVLYGSDAVSGVVQVFTRRPVSAVDMQLAVRGGTFNTREGDASLGARGALGPVQGGAIIGVAHHAGDGMLAFNNAYRNDVATLRADGSLGAARTVVMARHSDNSFQYPTDGAGRVVDRNARRSERRSSASAELSRPIGAHAEALVTLTALDVHGRTSDPSDGGADTLGFFAYRSLGVVRRRGAEARVVLRPSEGQAMSLGLEYGGEQQRSADSSNYDVSANRFAATRTTRAAYVQLVGDAGPLSYTVGGRYDDNDVYGVFRTGRAGLAARLWRGGRLRGALGTAFKAPTFLETFSSAFSVGNAALTPERSKSWEGGVEQQLAGGRVQLAATFFAQQFRDLVQYTYIAPATPNYFNVAAASARGLELSAQGDAARGVSVWGNATALRTRVDDAGFQTGRGATFVEGARLLRRPPLTVAAGVRFRRIVRTTLDLAATHVAARDDRDFSDFPASPVTLPAYTRLDLGGAYALGGADDFWNSASLTLRIENAFNARVEEVANFRSPGRVVLVGLRLGTAR